MRSNSPRTRAPDMPPICAASRRISRSVSASGANPSRAAYRTARNMRVASSMKLNGRSARTTPRRKSSRPSNGSSNSPQLSAASETAIALMEKSRRARSSAIIPGDTLGSAPGRAYDSRRAIAMSNRPLAVPMPNVLNCERATTAPPSAFAAASANSAVAPTADMSKSDTASPKSASRTPPPTSQHRSPKPSATRATVRSCAN